MLHEKNLSCPMRGSSPAPEVIIDRQYIELFYHNGYN
jgi:hypothetical protein